MIKYTNQTGKGAVKRPDHNVLVQTCLKFPGSRDPCTSDFRVLGSYKKKTNHHTHLDVVTGYCTFYGRRNWGSERLLKFRKLVNDKAGVQWVSSKHKYVCIWGLCMVLKRSPFQRSTVATCDPSIPGLHSELQDEVLAPSDYMWQPENQNLSMLGWLTRRLQCPYLLKSPESLKRAPPPGEEIFNTWAFGESPSSIQTTSPPMQDGHIRKRGEEKEVGKGMSSNMSAPLQGPFLIIL